MIKKLLYCSLVLFSINAMENKKPINSPSSLRQQSYYAIISYLKNNIISVEDIKNTFDYFHAMRQAYQDLSPELKNYISIDEIDKPEQDLYLKKIAPQHDFMFFLNIRSNLQNSPLEVYDLAKKSIIKKIILNKNYKTPTGCLPDSSLVWYDEATEKLSVYSPTTDTLKKDILYIKKLRSLHCIDNTTIAAHCFGHSLNIIDIQQPKIIKTLELDATIKKINAHQDVIYCTYFDDFRRGYTQVIRWDYQKGAEAINLWEAPFKCFFHRLQQSLLIAWEGSTIFVGDLSQESPSVLQLQNPSYICTLRSSGNYLAVGTHVDDHSVYLWDIATKQCCIKIPLEKSPITNLYWSYDQSSLITQNGKGNFCAIDLTFLKTLKNLFEEQQNNNNTAT